MQNVACPSTIVQKLKGISPRLNALRRLMPVMMPGSAIGRTRRSETVSRPKKRERQTAAAARVPSTSAMSVEAAATWSDRSSASWTSGRAHATPNQRRVSPGGGKTKLLSSALNA